MIEREQLLKEHDQLLKEMQLGLRTAEETRERLGEMDRLQTVLMERLGSARRLSYSDWDSDLLTSSTDSNSLIQSVPHFSY